MSARDRLAFYIGYEKADEDPDFERHLNAYRAEVIAERDAQIIAWLGKKAHEYGTSNRDARAKAEAVGRMADKLSRGAVR